MYEVGRLCTYLCVSGAMRRVHVRIHVEMCRQVDKYLLKNSYIVNSINSKYPDFRVLYQHIVIIHLSFKFKDFGVQQVSVQLPITK